MSGYKTSLLRAAGPLVVALSTLCATSAWSATQVSYKADFVTPDTPLTIEDIMEVDKLGFDCIHEDKIDLAFHATGKGVRMPRTCLPEPCDKALLPEELALLVGRPANEAEWEEYFSRYADVCRKEIPPISTDDSVSGEGQTDIEANGLTPIDAFWAPLIETFNSNTASSNTSTASNTGTRQSSPRGGAVQGGIFGGGSGGGTFSGQTDGTASPDIILANRTSSAGSASVSPVPLPAAIWMLLAGLACLVPWRMRRARAS